jgi:hypothetical protein
MTRRYRTRGARIVLAMASILMAAMHQEARALSTRSPALDFRDCFCRHISSTRAFIALGVAPLERRP